MAGSMRQRGRDAWELCVYLGVDPETGRQRWAPRTLHGTKRAARHALVELVADASHAHGVGARSERLGALLRNTDRAQRSPT
jgi:hypothetical protein